MKYPKNVSTINSLIIGVALVLGIIGYAYINGQTKLRVETLNQQREATNQKAKKLSYEECLQKAANTYQNKWISRCEANNIEVTVENGRKSCILADYMSSPLTEQYNKDKDTCLELYKSDK